MKIYKYCNIFGFWAYITIGNNSSGNSFLFRKNQTRRKNNQYSLKTSHGNDKISNDGKIWIYKPWKLSEYFDIFELNRYRTFKFTICWMFDSLSSLGIVTFGSSFKTKRVKLHLLSQWPTKNIMVPKVVVIATIFFYVINSNDININNNTQFMGKHFFLSIIINNQGYKSFYMLFISFFLNSDLFKTDSDKLLASFHAKIGLLHTRQSRFHNPVHPWLRTIFRTKTGKI